MSVQWVQSAWLWSARRGHHTHRVTFTPSVKVVTISLSQVSGGGLIYAGIRRYSYRPTPDGADQDVDFGEIFYNWPNFLGSINVGYDRLSSVTFALALGADQEAKALGQIFHF